MLKSLSIWKWALHALVLMLGVSAFVPQPARADIGVTATSEQASYVRGQTNTFVFHLALFSQVFETADNIHFGFPAGITVSAARYVDGFNTCPDALLLVLGMGTSDAGWFNPGHPSGCGYFYTGTGGEPQIFSIDADIPADYIGDLPVLISVEGDQCCDPPPHDASVTLTFADSASAATWNFDDVAAPALPGGWSTASSQSGIPWTTVLDFVNSAPNAVHVPTASRRGESSLTSPLVAIDPAGGELRFHQRFDTAQGLDGGVLEIAIDGGPFQDIVGAGGVFRVGGYDSRIVASAGCSGGNANPLLGREAWSGTQETFTTVAITLPGAASGHHARLRWRMGTDCAGPASTANGWWIDDVTVTSSAPVAAIGPDKIAISLDAGAQSAEAVGIGNVGGGSLDYAVTTAAAGSDCSNPAAVSWLQVITDHGTVGGGEFSETPIQVDATGLAAGEYAALICVATSDLTRPPLAIPVSLLVGACAPTDRLFADDFEASAQTFAAASVCTGSLRTFTRRDAFLAATADGYAEDRFTGLRTGPLFGPIEFGNGTFSYSVFTQDNPLNPSLFLFAGSGVLSTRSSGDQVTLTFTGAPVTALGGDFMGSLFSLNQRPLVPSTTIVLTLDDGSSESFKASSLDSFRGFISSKPILSLSVASPEIDENGDIPWGVADNLVVGQAR